MGALSWTSLLNVIAAVLPVVATAIIGNLVTLPNIPTWYAHLAKPPFNPPNWIFAPAWTMLYILMAAAFFRLLQTPGVRTAAIVLFLVQLVLNAAWSWVFFSQRSPSGALVVIALLWIAIAATILTFWQVDGIASALLWPYLAWVSFAAVLNWEIYRLN
jgi:tryptophan-rich sensory protein